MELEKRESVCKSIQFRWQERARLDETYDVRYDNKAESSSGDPIGPTFGAWYVRHFDPQPLVSPRMGIVSESAIPHYESCFRWVSLRLSILKA